MPDPEKKEVRIADALPERFEQTWRYPPRLYLLISLPWVLGLILTVHRWNEYRQIAPRQRTHRGVITSYEPKNHSSYGYTFTVRGSLYKGRESFIRGELRIGEQVRVYYDPQNPNKNSLFDFEQLAGSELGSMPLMILGILGLTGFVLWKRREERARNLRQGVGANRARGTNWHGRDGRKSVPHRK